MKNKLPKEMIKNNKVVIDTDLNIDIYKSSKKINNGIRKVSIKDNK